LRASRSERKQGGAPQGGDRGSVAQHARLRHLWEFEEYKQTQAVEHIVLVEPNEPVASVWSREAEGGWVESRPRGLDAKIELPAIGVTLEMAAIYEGVEFPVRPRLVSTEDPAG